MVTQWAHNRLALISALILLVAVGCRSDNGTLPTDPTPVPVESAVAEPAPRTAETTTTPGIPVPRPTVESEPLVTDEEREAALAARPAPLGTFVVAKIDAGIPTVLPPWRDGDVPLEIPVYDEPFGEARVLVYDNTIDDMQSRHPLLHGGEGSPPLVLRVLAGNADDEWIRVQAPTFPNRQSVWVRSLYFDFGFTTTRIEVDLAGEGELRLIEGGSILIESPIVQGRPGRETPTHVTYIDGGVEGRFVNSAFGAAQLSLASFSEKLGSFGAPGSAPRTYLHGNTAPGVMGQAVSSGEIRVPDDVIIDLSSRVQPGTPVMIFDSSRPATSIDAIAGQPHAAARTVSFVDTDLPVGQASSVFQDQLWRRCISITRPLICLTAPNDNAAPLVPVGSVFLTAKPDAGQELVDVGNLVPVYDEPGGPKRLLVDSNPIDGVDQAYPTYHPTLFRQPLVLRVIQGAPGDEWLLVQAPIRPHRQSVWVRADDFDFGQTTKRFEVDLGNDGLFTFFDGADEILTQPTVYGRESRPTVLHDTYVEQVFVGTTLSPAYGSYILTLASYSQVLGTYGGGMPGQSIHGTNQPELMGMRASSGGIRVPNEVIEFVQKQPGIVGASVIIYDSTGTTREQAIRQQRNKAWFPAMTTTFPFTGLPFAKAHSYS